VEACVVVQLLVDFVVVKEWLSMREFAERERSGLASGVKRSCEAAGQ
jgi:hypothetical protein